MARIPALALAVLLAVPLAARAQVQPVVPAPTQNFPAAVSALAPQLVNFAGSTANFQNLVNGLAQGLPVTLIGITPDGLQQTATFTPSGAMSTVQIAQTLEQAREALITRGIAAPTPEQIGVALLGGRLPTPAGSATVAGVLPGSQAAAAAATASTGSPGARAATSLQLDVRPVAQPAAALPGAAVGTVQPPAMTSASPRVSNTSDSPFLGNTSDSPLPPTNVPSAASPGGVAGAGAVTNTSPAAQMQNRR